MDTSGKYAAAGAIFSVGVLAGGAPACFAGNPNPGIPKTSLLVLMDGFAAGVFLGGGLIHLLNDAIERLADYDYPMAPAVCGAAMWALLVLEGQHAPSAEHRRRASIARSPDGRDRDRDRDRDPSHDSSRDSSHDTDRDNWDYGGGLDTPLLPDDGDSVFAPLGPRAGGAAAASRGAHRTASGAAAVETANFGAWTMLGGLGVHSTIAGLSLGVAPSSDGLAILVAILSHKGVAAFALGSTLLSTDFPLWKRRAVIIGFATATPIGILGGIQIGERINADGPATGVLLAIASGMFLYVGMFHLLADNLENIKKNRQTTRLLFLMAMLLGYAMMALLALWV